MRALVILVPLAVLSAPSLPAAEPSPTTIVVCAPGYPGSTAEAQGAMDVFAAAVAGGAGLPAGSVAAVYEETEVAGVARIGARDAGLVLVPLPFFLKHEKDLSLTARLQVAPKGRGALERWALVAKKGRVTGPASLEGITVGSLAGYAPGFVRAALAGFGALPPGAKIVQSGAVLSSLRRAVAGEPVAVLLDGEQAAALPTLPFAAELEVVARSPELPTAIVATTGARVPAAKLAAVSRGLLGLAARPEGAAALEGIRMTGFVPLDEKALASARKAYLEASK